MFRPKPTYHPEIEGLISFELDSFQDHRGMNAEIWKFYGSHCGEHWELDSYSISKKNVLRGAHYDQYNDKLIQILFGKVQMFVIDVRKDSSTFNNTKEFILDYKKPTQLFVPKNCANAHLILSNSCVFYYKWSYGYRKQSLIKWNDPKFNLKWRAKSPILSDRDK